MVCNPTIQYALYESMVAKLERHPSRGEVFVISSLGKVGATLATYPLLVIKSRLQVEGSKHTDMKYKGSLDALLSILQTEGPAALYRGMGNKIFQARTEHDHYSVLYTGGFA